MSDFGTNPPVPPNAYPANDQLPGVPAPVYGSGAVPSPDERTMAMLAELLQLFSWMIGPLIIFLVKRDSAFVRFHAFQAMLWQLVMTMFSIVFFVVVVALTLATPRSGGAHSPVSVLFLMGFYAVFGLFSVANIVIAIYFAVKANGGAWASYPVIGRIARSILGLASATR